MHTSDRDGRAESELADDLLPALEVIDQQPLAARAASYAAIVDALAQKLDAAPAP